MRVIAGTARGRRLEAPKGQTTRPTPDRVREALFSILQAEVPEAQVLDLFAGTGALGLEALSRGARAVVFVDADRRAAELVRRNLASLGFTAAEVLQLPAPRALELLARRGVRFDIAFLDPPYAEAQLLSDSLARLAAARLLCPGAVVVCEHASRDEPPATPEGLERADTRRYGDVALTFYRFVKGSPP